jgi:hypothetical protein
MNPKTQYRGDAKDRLGARAMYTRVDTPGTISAPAARIDVGCFRPAPEFGVHISEHNTSLLSSFLTLVKLDSSQTSLTVAALIRSDDFLGFSEFRRINYRAYWQRQFHQPGATPLRSLIPTSNLTSTIRITLLASLPSPTSHTYLHSRLKSLITHTVVYEAHTNDIRHPTCRMK